MVFVLVMKDWFAGKHSLNFHPVYFWLLLTPFVAKRHFCVRFGQEKHICFTVTLMKTKLFIWPGESKLKSGGQ